MRVLMIGDVVGKPGRRAVKQMVPQLRREHDLDLVVANVENAAGGLGVTPETAEEFIAAGVDVLTTGNHAWSKREIFPYMESEFPIIRPVNYPPGVPGRGYIVFQDVLIVNVIGRVFMGAYDDPFRAVDEVLERAPEHGPVVLVDCHAETTSEKGAMGWHLDGRVSAVVGTHTHVGTVDTRILPGGTAYVTDIGMTGPWNSIIGNTVEDVLERFHTQLNVRLTVPAGPARFHSVLIDADSATGKARSISRIDCDVD
jgi:metallophosphoesterase (TIGR00282 family)